MVPIEAFQSATSCRQGSVGDCQRMRTVVDRSLRESCDTSQKLELAKLAAILIGNGDCIFYENR